jgi:ppGpp synthetase/RelA/SpoT-type nucleotidyltranferase
MKIENLPTKKLRDDFQASNPVIEIQVASVLMHAWAERDHDLVYKTLTSGPASREERCLLDATNGLVHTGEVFLQQLQTAMDTVPESRIRTNLLATNMSYERF